jgi:hypothetical protein
MKHFYNRPILLMGDGLEGKLMSFFFLQIKRKRGLTTFITKEAGINGKWLNPDKPYNISAEHLFKIIEKKVDFQGREECMKDIEEFMDYFFKIVQEMRKSRMDPP